MVPSNRSFFQYCDSNIGLFSIAPCKGITLNPLCILLVSVLCLFFDGSLSKVIALPSIVITTTIADAIVGRALTIWKAIQKRSHEPINKTHTKIEAKRLRATTFAIAKLEER